jgi:hypothetical protein
MNAADIKANIPLNQGKGFEVGIADAPASLHVDRRSTT